VRAVWVKKGRIWADAKGGAENKITAKSEAAKWGGGDRDTPRANILSLIHHVLIQGEEKQLNSEKREEIGVN